MNSDTFACAKFLEEYLKAMKTDKLDLALTGNHLKSNSSFHIETDVAIYKNNQKVSLFMHRLGQAMNNISESGHPDASLRNQLIDNFLSDSNLKIGRLSPNFGIKWQEPLIKFKSFEESLLFNGTIRLIHGPESKTISHHDLCDKLNAKSSTRALLRTSDLKNILVVSSAKEYESAMHKKINWVPEPRVAIVQ